MRLTSIAVALVAALSSTGCQTAARHATVETTYALSSVRTVDAGCATCVFDMKVDADCPLAVRINGKPYLVSGSNIDDHGDAHASDGLCNAMRRAKVTGEIKDDRFVAESFELLPLGDADTD